MLSGFGYVMSDQVPLQTNGIKWTIAWKLLLLAPQRRPLSCYKCHIQYLCLHKLKMRMVAQYAICLCGQRWCNWGQMRRHLHANQSHDALNNFIVSRWWQLMDKYLHLTFLLLEIGSFILILTYLVLPFLFRFGWNLSKLFRLNCLLMVSFNSSSVAILDVTRSSFPRVNRDLPLLPSFLTSILPSGDNFCHYAIES